MYQANVLDPVQSTLSPLVWDHPEAERPELKSHLAHWITKHVFQVLESGGYDKPEQWAHLVLTGSLTTYQYSDQSDCDVSLFIDSKHLPEWSRAEMIGLMIGGTDGVTLPGTPYELQCYVVPPDIKPHDLYKKGLRSGYDIKTGKWFEPPDHERDHDVSQQENGFYTYALEQADKMEKLLRYEPDKAVQFWHQIHRKRMRDQTIGKGDFSESNIVYKFLANRGLLPQIAQTSGEYIAKTESPFAITVRTMRRDGFSDEEIDSWANYLAMHNEADRDSGELDDVPDEQVERWYENWESDGMLKTAAIDPTVCDRCGGPMSEPHQMGNRWMNTCLKCGINRQVSTQSPMLQDYRKQQQLSPYPQMLQDAGPTRPWYTAKTAAFDPNTLVQTILGSGGATVDLNGQPASSGFAVAVPGQEQQIPQGQFSPQSIEAYVQQHMNQLSQPNAYLGAWVHGGIVFLDISHVRPDQQTAMQEAEASNQLAIFDLSTGQEIPVQNNRQLTPQGWTAGVTQS